MQISAQISLYPLKQEKLSPAVEGVWKILEERGLAFEKGNMSTVVVGEGEKVFAAIQDAFLGAAARGAVSMVVTFSNACPIC
jgi:uncharacterized protein YqgV (UPF0045/DUF77 family)